ncbi:hypothetical protein ABH920_000309 [Catenulispora sp. EB89]|uniref:cell wall-binding repeat-containing protein n=1 Tax=Catenulispora sp. EB89 TaxID=3156257 RepID=UPI00351383B5
MRPRRLTTASRTAILGTLACGVSVAGMSPASAAPTAAPLLTGQVVFAYNPSPNTNVTDGIAVANPDGSGLKAIPLSGPGLLTYGRIAQVKVSPDGRHLSFLESNTSNPEGQVLVVADSDGSNATAVPVPALGSGDTVTFDGYQWSPDSSWLYVHDMDQHTGTMYLSRIHPDGTGLQRLTQAPGLPFSVAEQTGEIGWGTNGPGSYTIFNPATNATRTVPVQWFDSCESLSPDGKFLAILQGGSGHVSQIVVRPTDGSPEWIAQSTAVYDNSVNGLADNQPQWSPNESQLLFHSATLGQTVGSSSGGNSADAQIPASGASRGIGGWVPLPAGTPLNPPTATSQTPTPTPVPNPVPTPASAGPKVYRDAGSDRIGTGIAISQQRWTASGSAKAVVLATSLNYPDALSGGPLAAKKGGPLLLTDGSATHLDPRVLAEIQRVLPHGGAIHVLGGDSAMNPAIVSQLKSLGYAVTQYKGVNRADTALRVARDGMGSPQHVVLATGAGFADALAAGPYAAGPFAVAPGAPAAIVLSDGANLDPATAAFLKGKTVATVGAQAGHAWPAAAKSFSGLDRFDTAALVARQFTGVFATTQVGIANGVASATNPGYPDALTGGTFMAESDGPIVLVDGINSKVPTESASVLGARTGNIRADIFGGTSIITPSLAASIVKLLHGTAQF